MKFKLKIKTNPNFSTIFSIPSSNDYQEIKRLKFVPSVSSSAQVVEPKFGNKLLFLERETNQKEIELNFLYTPKARRVQILKQFLVTDYEKKVEIVDDKYISGSDSYISSLSKSINGSEKDVERIISNSYQYCLENLTYGKPIKGLYSFSQVKSDKVTDCGGYSTFLGSLLAARRIPVRIIVGFVLIRNRKKALIDKFVSQQYSFNDLSMHAWLEAMLPDESWFPLDASVEWRRVNGLSARQGGFGYIPADRLVTSFGHNISFSARNERFVVEILQDPATIVSLS